jgi:hypothetical protein
LVLVAGLVRAMVFAVEVMGPVPVEVTVADDSAELEGARTMVESTDTDQPISPAVSRRPGASALQVDAR